MRPGSGTSSAMSRFSWGLFIVILDSGSGRRFLSPLPPWNNESNQIVARPFRSISYGDGDPWFLPLFGQFCGRSLVKKSPQRLPKDGTRILRQPESISDLAF